MFSLSDQFNHCIAASILGLGKLIAVKLPLRQSIATTAEGSGFSI
jgi:hypothetical protein